MKIALLGTGKTGGKFEELALSDSSVTLTSFNSKHPATLQDLSQHDLIVSFLPGHIFLEYLPLILESKKTLITGSTGFDWPSNTDHILQQNKQLIIHATNFSLGMNLVKEMIHKLSKAEGLFDQFQFHIHEIHHTKKLDAPSGTALSWKKWLGHNSVITSERTGDVIGFHQMTLDTPFEKIAITHEALDRKIFAQGALWACKQLYHTKNTYQGLVQFQDFVQKELA